MTYPDPQYLGAGGELSATHRGHDHKADLTYANGNKVHYLATGESTDGQFGLYRWEMGPEPSGPAPHFHRSISESFYILTGTVRIYDGSRWIDTVPGDFVHVPVGGIHAFRNESGQPASMLLHFAPGAPERATSRTYPTWRSSRTRSRRPSSSATTASGSSPNCPWAGSLGSGELRRSGG